MFNKFLISELSNTPAGLEVVLLDCLCADVLGVGISSAQVWETTRFAESWKARRIHATFRAANMADAFRHTAEKTLEVQLPKVPK
jgi:hypothetical protein